MTVHDGVSIDDYVGDILMAISDDEMIHGFAFGVDEDGRRCMVASAHPRRLFATYEPNRVALDCAAIATLTHALDRSGLKAQGGLDD